MDEKVRKQVDWDGIEIQFRAGIRSLVDIGKEFGVSNAAIHKRSKAKGWTRDLSARIKAKADAKVNAAVVNDLVNAEKAINEKQVVEANAEVQYQVRMKHRSGLSRLCVAKDKMLDALESVVDNMSDVADVIEMLRNPGEDGMDRINDRMKKAMDRSALIDDLKKLAEVDEKVRRGEREAFGIDDSERGMSPIDEVLKKINASS